MKPILNITKDREIAKQHLESANMHHRIRIYSYSHFIKDENTKTILIRKENNTLSIVHENFSTQPEYFRKISLFNKVNKTNLIR